MVHGTRRRALLLVVVGGFVWIFTISSQFYPSIWFKAHEFSWQWKIERRQETGEEERYNDPFHTFSPFPRQGPRHDPRKEQETFLSYLPHSQFHHQRIALQNALSLAKSLNRTLLLPPLWVGTSPTVHSFDQLQQAWDDRVRGDLLFTLNPPDNEGVTGKKKLRGNTFVSMEDIFDLRRLERESGVRLLHRWWGDGTGQWPGMTLEGVRWDAGGISQDDVYLVKSIHSLRVSANHQTPLASQDEEPPVSLSDLRSISKPLLLFGSLYTDQQTIIPNPNWIQDKLHFSNHAISSISHIIVRALKQKSQEQGREGYLSIVTIGANSETKKEQMSGLFDRVVQSLVSKVDESSRQIILSRLQKMISEPRRQNGHLRVVSSGIQLRCPLPLHKDPSLDILNTPIFLVAHSRTPISDPDLYNFFQAFPCMFTLGDWDGRGIGVAEVRKWTNVDGEALGSLFVPQLEGLVVSSSAEMFVA